MPHRLLDKWNRISLRTKVTGVTVLLLTLGLLVTGLGTMAMLRPYVTELADKKVAAIAQSDLGNYLTVTTKDADGLDSSDLRLDTTDADVYIALFNPAGDFVGHSWAKRDTDDWPLISTHLSLAEVYSVNSNSENGLHVVDLVNGHGDNAFRAAAVPVQWDTSGNIGTAIVAISTSQSDRVLTAYFTIFLGFGISVVLIGALLTRMLVTSTFTPLREVERTAAAIADGDFSQRLGGATPNTEVGRLNASLNTMLNRIDRAFRDRARTIDQMRRFVGDASHELRTPLVSVRGYAELYRMGALQTPEDVAQAMERIEKEAIRMGGLVEDLLELARLDDPKPLRFTPVDLVPLARDAALDATAISPSRTITVVPPSQVALPAAPAPSEPEQSEPTDIAQTGPVSFAGATLARLRGRRPKKAETAPQPTITPERAVLPPVASPEPPSAIVLADENKIRQIITNLMGNAMRFTPDDSPIEIRVGVDTSDARVSLEVVDHGDGIPPQIREKIFQRFWRADSSRARETGGSGLGLAIVSSIVATHNGTVDVVETPGGGATFRVRLPLADSPAAPQPIDA